MMIADLNVGRCIVSIYNDVRTYARTQYVLGIHTHAGRFPNFYLSYFV